MSTNKLALHQATMAKNLPEADQMHEFRLFCHCLENLYPFHEG